MPHCSFQRLPVGVPFCNCKPNQKQYLLCKCGEECNVHEWAWEKEGITSATLLGQEDREVHFHPGYSSGTAAVRGTTPCTAGHDYYWEIKMLTPVYGTDVMVGVGTKKLNLNKSELQFCSLLGSDEESWGYSYNGALHHNGVFKNYGPSFGKGSIVGVHLDMWKGELTFYLNRKCLGTAFTSLRAHELYPMVSSTAAQSAMRVIYSYSCTSSLQHLCLQAISANPCLLSDIRLVPGLRAHMRRTFWWYAPYRPEDEQNVKGVYNSDEFEENLQKIVNDTENLLNVTENIEVPVVMAGGRSNSTVGKSRRTAPRPHTKRRRPLPVGPSNTIKESTSSKATEVNSDEIKSKYYQASSSEPRRSRRNKTLTSV